MNVKNSKDVKFAFVSHCNMENRHNTIEKAVYKGGVIYRISTTPYRNGVSNGERKLSYYVYNEYYPSLEEAMKVFD